MKNIIIFCFCLFFSCYSVVSADEFEFGSGPPPLIPQTKTTTTVGQESRILKEADNAAKILINNPQFEFAPVEVDLDAHRNKLKEKLKKSIPILRNKNHTKKADIFLEIIDTDYRKIKPKDRKRAFKRLRENDKK